MATATQQHERTTIASQRKVLPVLLIVFLVGGFIVGYVAHGDTRHGPRTHVYSGTITLVSGSTDHTAIALNVGGTNSNGFAYAPGVRDANVKVGERVTVYTVEIPGRGEEIVDIEAAP